MGALTGIASHVAPPLRFEVGRSGRLVVLLACLVLVAHPAWAHDAAPLGLPHVASSPPHLEPASPTSLPALIAATRIYPETTGFWLLLLVASFGILGARAGPRRIVAGLLVVGLAPFSVEAAVHSVHHLGDRKEASRCDVATIAGQLSAVPADAVVFDLALIVVGSAPPADPPAPGRRLLFSPNRGRAPPVSPSV